MNTIDQLWGRIEANLSLGVSSPSVQLTSGASPQAIEQLETVIGVVLPEDFRASCRRHDGGFAMQLIAPIEIVVEILSVQQIAETWRIHADLLLDDTWARQPPYYFSEDVVRSGWHTGPILPVWWSRLWIPIGSDSAGNLSCLDLAPMAGGTVGQVIDWDHECGPSRVLFPSFESFLAAWADQLVKFDDE